MALVASYGIKTVNAQGNATNANGSPPTTLPVAVGASLTDYHQFHVFGVLIYRLYVRPFYTNFRKIMAPMTYNGNTLAIKNRQTYNAVINDPYDASGTNDILVLLEISSVGVTRTTRGVVRIIIYSDNVLLGFLVTHIIIIFQQVRFWGRDSGNNDSSAATNSRGQ
ncbi:MAG: hypothetical protein WA364_10315 [Candidatus Nitrosopolaris sp.]